jgi:hypothetical protein
VQQGIQQYASVKPQLRIVTSIDAGVPDRARLDVVRLQQVTLLLSL